MRTIAAIPILLACGVLDAATPPAGFVEISLVDGTAATGALTPTAAAYEPGSGKLFVLEKGSGAQGTARVRVRDGVSGAVTTALSLSCVDGQGERGLLGIAFDPDYLDPGGAHRHVYLYYTRAFGGLCLTGSGIRNRVSRFEEAGGTLSGEQVLLEGPDLVAKNHNGGTLRFAADKTLLISMGDNDTDADPAPASRDLNDLRGKILRIGRDGTIPADNPFFGQAGKRGEVWAWGLRNPFRFSVDADTGDVYIADVGEGTWEEVDFGVAGGDYGYPCFEGPETFRPCAPLPASIAPRYVYGHANQTPPVSGASITGGPVYRHSAFPADYHGDYFFGDYVGGWIRRANIAPDHTLGGVQMFLPDATGVVDMAISPEGCLTWVGVNGAGVREVCDVLTRADIDDSLRVDGFDLVLLAKAFASSCGSGLYVPAADLDGDCVIDGADLALLTSVFGLVRQAD